MKRNEKFASENGFEEWGDYMGAKISKLEEQFRQSAAACVDVKLSDLFAGISIFVNGYTKPSADELKRLMMQHGGIYHHYKRPTTTYVIASNLCDVKIKSITSDVIIGPEWVVECIEQMRIIDYKKYLLYTNHKPSQPKLMFGRVDRNLEIQKPATKSNDKNDITNEEVLNLMSKLSALNEKYQESVAHEKCTPKVESSFTDQDHDDAENIPTQIESASLVESTRGTEIANDSSLSSEQKSECSSKGANTTKSSLTATDPNFLQEFFNNSRLHHIATLGAGFKQYVAELRESHTGTFPDRSALQTIECKTSEFESQGPYVMHIDMDCFFVSVGLRKYPSLRGHPVAVTHSKGSEAGRVQSRPGQNRSLEIELYQKRLAERHKTPDIPYESRLLNIDDNNSMSEIASCSYEARKMGVKNGMFVGSALKLCPDLKTIPYDFDGYREVAFTLYNTIAKYTLNIEAVSCDEMFVDLTELISSTGVNLMDFVSFIRGQIKQTTGCPCSAGLGANRLQARMATKKAKPDGQFYLAPDTVQEYMINIPISDLPGIGPSTTHRLKQLSCTSCGELQKVSCIILQREFGKKIGDTIYNACRGIDERPLVYEQVRKSVSVDVNYGIRFRDDTEVERFMKQLTEEIHKRLLDIKKRGKLITVKLLVRSPEAPIETAKFMGHGLCDIITKSFSLKEHTSDLSVIEKTVLSLMKQISAPPHELRGIGLQISKFEETKPFHVAKNTLKMMFQKAEAKHETTKNDSVKGMDETIKTSPVKQISPEKEITPIEAVNTSSTSTVTPIKQSTLKTRNSVPKYGRGRGRPPKYPITSKPKQQNNDMMRFLREPKIKEDSIPEGIDPDFLAALPADIRAEVIKDYRYQANKKNNSDATTSKEALPKPPPVDETAILPKAEKITVDVKFLEALPADLRREVEKQIELQKDTMQITSTEPEFHEHLQVTPEPSPVKYTSKKSPCSTPTRCETDQSVTESDNILLRSDWRNLLTAWIESADEPEDVDIDMIAANARQLVEWRKLCELHLGLRFLFRIINDRNLCSWHKAYFRIVHSMQQGMREVYRSKLAVRNDFDCSDKDCYSAWQ
ncbi:DNA repair protein Rev1 [Malaya genurostris]|uniref:DNA repair protein Rev1 n=1 Tax=Malaya genurostris TaxID=325434 RepID=UPI0026F3A7DF|nr:DNA repair protein Rev1 [Malaya genurostris]